eukprot:6633780-Alexandrium_andersonii.AAC.1
MRRGPISDIPMRARREAGKVLRGAVPVATLEKLLAAGGPVVLRLVAPCAVVLLLERCAAAAARLS